MKKLLASCLFSFAFCYTFGQIHYPDEYWPVGVNELPGAPGNGNAWLHFYDDTVEVQLADLQMNFESTVAVATNQSGQLEFYSNGCEIRSANGALMDNGDGINPGELHDWVCSNGYVLPRSAMALPVPGSQSEWILLHMGGQYDAFHKFIYSNFYSSSIDMTANGGDGKVIDKNNLIFEGVLEPFSVVRHGNGRDLWIVLPEYATNIYRLYLLGPTGLVFHGSQQIGPAIGCRRIGSSIFSLDGSNFARTNNCRAVVLDFDRCSGTLSQPVVLDRPTGTLGGGGLVFSSNNRWLYATSQLSIFRADLNSSSPFLDSLFKQPYFEGESEYVFGTSLSYMQQAPDGKVYMGSQHREQYLSILKLEADTFTYNFGKIDLPVESVRSLPHFPNFRLYDLCESPCDSLGIDTATDDFSEKTTPAILIWPNPANGGEVKVEVTEPLGAQPVSLRLYNAVGQLVAAWPLAAGEQRLDLGGLAGGLYLWQATAGEREIGSGKLVVIKQ